MVRIVGLHSMRDMCLHSMQVHRVVPVQWQYEYEGGSLYSMNDQRTTYAFPTCRFTMYTWYRLLCLGLSLIYDLCHEFLAVRSGVWTKE